MSTTTTTPILCCQCGTQLAVLEQLPVSNNNNQLHCSKCGLGSVIDTTPAPDTTTTGS